eukprot:m.242485 g.242485  ORF g.242485 m.242485 type:complete len:345 (+) comp25735_c0_seq1:1465-2499(+)
MSTPMAALRCSILPAQKPAPRLSPCSLWGTILSPASPCTVCCACALISSPPSTTPLSPSGAFLHRQFASASPQCGGKILSMHSLSPAHILILAMILQESSRCSRPAALSTSSSRKSPPSFAGRSERIAPTGQRVPTFRRSSFLDEWPGTTSPAIRQIRCSRQCSRTLWRLTRRWTLTRTRQRPILGPFLSWTSTRVTRRCTQSSSLGACLSKACVHLYMDGCLLQDCLLLIFSLACMVYFRCPWRSDSVLRSDPLCLPLYMRSFSDAYFFLQHFILSSVCATCAYSLSYELDCRAVFSSAPHLYLVFFYFSVSSIPVSLCRPVSSLHVSVHTLCLLVRCFASLD